MDGVSIVVIPAHNEEDRIVECLEALAAQTIGIDRFEIVLVADACIDATEGVAVRAADQLGLTLRVLPGPGQGAGPARQVGMNAAAARLCAPGAERSLIATTDADSRPHADWLERQLAHLRAGACVIAGMIELDPAEAAQLPARVLDRRTRDAARRLKHIHASDSAAQHHHFAGASLALTAATYLQVGGLEPLPALEDAAFARRLQEHGIPILRASDVRVRTSARAHGRASRGLAVDLAVSSWLERRRYRAKDFPIRQMQARKGDRTVSVIVPTKQCAETIGGVLRATVAPLRAAGLVDEVIVVDANSQDGTTRIASQAGARMLQQDDLLTEYGPARGKGDAMWRALSASTGELVCFLDGDTADPDPRHLQGLLGPLLADPSLTLVKGTFDRPLRTAGGELPHEGGRVTELMARPLLNLHEPRLAGFTQPLAGEFAATRVLLESLTFPAGYGVEIAVLIDALRTGGLDSLAECQLGIRHNRHQPLRELGAMAYAVLAAVEQRIGPRSPLGGHYLRPWDDGEIGVVLIEERPALTSIAPADAPELAVVN